MAKLTNEQELIIAIVIGLCVIGFVGDIFSF